MNRRSFIRGAFALAGAALVPSFTTVEKVTLRFPRQELENALVTPEELGRRMAEALAKSMMQTREQVAANVMTRVFWDHDTDFLNVEGISHEEMYRG